MRVLYLLCFIVCLSYTFASPVPETSTDSLLNFYLFEQPAPPVFRPVNIDRRDADWDSLFTRWQARHGFSGTVLVAERGEILHTGAYGYRRLGANKDTLQIESSFQLASVSKMITAIAVMQLAERNQLLLDADIRVYIPELPYFGVKVRHLLNHRSGLPRYEYLVDNYVLRDKRITNRDAMCLLAGMRPPINFKPGEHFKYNNTNYMLLALIVEEASGIPFSRYVRENIFIPAGMKNSWIAGEDPAYSGVDEMALGHRGIPHRIYGRTYWRRSRSGKRYRRRKVVGYRYTYPRAVSDPLDYVAGDKSAYSSVVDLFHLDQALYTDRLVSRTMLRQAFSPGSPERRTWADNYGFGWRLRPQESGIVYHFGWWRGYRTAFIRDIKNQRTLIILGNRDHILRSINFRYFVNNWEGYGELFPQKDSTGV